MREHGGRMGGVAVTNTSGRCARALRATAAGALAAVVLGVPASPAAAATDAAALFTWGSDTYGELGNGIDEGSNVGHPTPAIQPEDVTFQQVAAGDGTSAALADDGTIYTWGIRADYPDGNGLAPEPVPVPGVTFQAVAAGTDFFVALADNGTVHTWGDNSQAQLGNGGRGGFQPDPAAIIMPGGASIKAITAGNTFAMALGEDGTIYTWGSNGFGQIGSGSGDQYQTSPGPVAPTGVTFAAIAAGHDFALALADDDRGTLYGWGSNTLGKLGNGNADDGFHLSPEPGTMPPGVTFTDVAAGGDFGLARAADGTVYSWGYAGDGQLGYRTGDEHNATPSPVTMPDGVTFDAIDAGNRFAAALTGDGDAYLWGDNSASQLGIGAGDDAHTPVRVPGIEFPALATGATHVVSLAIPLPLPWQIAAGDGGGQTVHVNDDFPDPLVATVTASNGAPVPGVTVTFTINSPAAFPDGASTAQAPTGDDGTATSPQLTATGQPGDVTVQASAGGVSGSATFQLTVLPDPSPSPSPVPSPTPGATPAPGSSPSATHSGGLPATGGPGIRLLVVGTALAAVGMLAVAAIRPARQRQ